jgi:hypothetical protein
MSPSTRDTLIEARMIEMAEVVVMRPSADPLDMPDYFQIVRQYWLGGELVAEEEGPWLHSSVCKS